MVCSETGRLGRRFLVLRNLTIYSSSKKLEDAVLTGLLRDLSSNRFVRFASIGMGCLVLVQDPILWVLLMQGVLAVMANALGFMASAVVNYALQRRLNYGDVKQG